MIGVQVHTLPCALSLDMVWDTERQRLADGLGGAGAGGGAVAATALMTTAAFLRPAGTFATDAIRVVSDDN